MSKEILIFGFIAGVAVRSFVNFGIFFAGLFLAFSVLLFLTEHYYKKFLIKEVRLKTLSLIFLSFSFGVAWYDFREAPQSNFFKENQDRVVLIKGIIDSEPESKEAGTSLKILIKNDEIEEPILVKTENFPKYNYGDEVELRGELKPVENFDESFDYVSYLAKDGIYYAMDKPQINLLSTGNGSFLNKKLFEIKEFFLGSIKEIFSEPHSSLLAGLLIGAKESLGKEWLDKFRIAGLSHIIVLSGYNLTIIADAVMKVISLFFSKSISLLLGSVSIVLFAVMTGGGASTTRATIMALIIMLSKATGRMYEATSALVLAGFFMVLQNPKVLVFDMSFQLSFLATLGLIFISPLVKEKITFVPEKFQLRELMATTLGAQIATSPLILYKMGTFSLVALPVNILVLLFIPVTMLFGFMATAISFVNFYLALPFAGIAFTLLSYILFITDVFSSLPFASVNFNVNYLFFAFGIVLLFLVFKNILIYKKEEDWEIEEINHDSKK
ncbi:MAG: ComEC/Rec2 family competence protein [bacterium]